MNYENQFGNNRNIWVWRSLVARLNGVQEVAGSIPVTQTIEITRLESLFYFSKNTHKTPFTAILLQRGFTN